jgi:hypothetical protein
LIGYQEKDKEGKFLPEVKPGFRQIRIHDNCIVELGMQQIEKPAPTASFEPGVAEVLFIGTGSLKYTGREQDPIVVVADLPNPDDLTYRFELIDLGHSRIALKASNGKYLRAENGGGGRLFADRTHIKSHETFRRWSRGGNFALETADGSLLQITQEGNEYVLRANGNNQENRGNLFHFPKVSPRKRVTISASTRLRPGTVGTFTVAPNCLEPPIEYQWTYGHAMLVSHKHKAERTITLWFPVPGRYEVQIAATDASGSILENSKTIIVEGVIL